MARPKGFKYKDLWPEMTVARRIFNQLSALPKKQRHLVMTMVWSHFKEMAEKERQAKKGEIVLTEETDVNYGS